MKDYRPRIGMRFVQQGRAFLFHIGAGRRREGVKMREASLRSLLHFRISRERCDRCNPNFSKKRRCLHRQLCHPAQWYPVTARASSVSETRSSQPRLPSERFRASPCQPRCQALLSNICTAP
jgi:hypothetical protein